MIAIAGGLLAALGILAGALLGAAPFGLVAAEPGLSLWILFPLLTMAGWFLLVVSDLDPLRGTATRFVATPLPVPPGPPPQTLRPTNPNLAHIVSWISAVGAAVALADIEGAGVANDAC